jgi:hypothetical protein
LRAKEKRIVKKTITLGLCLFALIAALEAVGVKDGARAQSTGRAQAQPAPRLRADLGRMPLYFIENRGQMDARVGYYVQGKDQAVYFGAEGLTFALTKASENARWAVKLDFLGANPGVRPVGRDETGAVISLFKGARADWKTGLQTYSRVVYEGLWPGIDLVYSGTADRLKAEFAVKPGADPSLIRMAYRGAESVSLAGDGRLAIKTPVSSFEDEAPLAWQDVDGVRSEVEARYDLAEPETAADGAKRFGYGFELGDYDPTLPLTLDPAVLVYCGFIGGSDLDGADAITVDGSGNIFVTGSTASPETSFPAAVGPDLTSNGSPVSDAFVAKLNPAGTALLYCGYIGGTSGEAGRGIAVDAAGNAYVAGETRSDSGSGFPATAGPDLTFNGISDAFVAKVNAAGTALLYCGYIGGSGQEGAWDLALDGAGNVYVAGRTTSTSDLPTNVGPDLSSNGGTDAFIAKVNAGGSALDYCGFIGGAGSDEAWEIAVDGSGRAYVGGYTASDSSTFPVKTGPDLTYNGGGDAFVAKVNAAGSALDYCGYIGGNDYEIACAISLDAVGNAYVTGETYSEASTFPAAVGPNLSYIGNGDAFAAKVNAAGSALVYCGYIGGAGDDCGYGIAVDAAGNAYVAGQTESTETTFPVMDGPDLTYNGSYDAFVAKVDLSGTALLYCGYIGGSGEDIATSIAADAAGNAYVAGRTGSTETTFPVAGGPDLTFNGFRDAFVAKVSTGAGAGSIRVTSPNGGERWQAGARHPITWLSGNKAGYDKIVYSTDKGATWKEIVFSTPDDESYLWTVPNDVSGTVWVRVAEREGPGYDRSDAVFSIVPASTVAVVSPNGGESWLAGTTHTIRWTTTGTFGPVKIGYSVDNGLNWATIAASAPNTGSFTWVVPSKPSTQCKVRVRDAADNIPADTSNGTFTIKIQ